MYSILKVAKEYNVSIHTIVKHLTDKGFNVESKPTFRLSEEMYESIRTKFQESKIIKEKIEERELADKVKKSLDDLIL